LEVDRFVLFAFEAAFTARTGHQCTTFELSIKMPDFIAPNLWPLIRLKMQNEMDILNELHSCSILFMPRLNVREDKNV